VNTPLTHLQIADIILDAGLFHQTYYERQRSRRFATARDALADFIGEGVQCALSPHPLFSVPFYLRRNAEVVRSGANPVLHYLLGGWQEGRDPHPLFDGRWYCAQVGPLNGLNPLSHYLRYAARDCGSPNRLFDTRLYLERHADTARAGVNPLEHYVLYGRDEGRVPHRDMQGIVAAWRDSRVSLKRGAWTRAQTIWLAARPTERSGGLSRLLDLAKELAGRCRVDVRVVLDRDCPLRPDFERVARTVCLEDFGAHTTPEAGREPSTLRMLLFALLGDVRDVTLWDAAAVAPLADAFADLGISVSSVTQGTLPPPEDERDTPVSTYVTAVIEASPLPSVRSIRPRLAPRRVIVPCKDWSLSGVHTVAETLGRELIARGWDVRLLFTRGTIGVLDNLSHAALPEVPYEFLDVSLCHSVREHCAAMIRYFERQAPCVLLCAFDDLANAVAPALTDQVGVVGWLQSDEAHYYESAYRLGRYWNRIVCVSDVIASRLEGLNASLSDRVCRIYNSTVPSASVVAERDFLEHGRLRLVYMGRLVQYQKRVLDVIPLVHALERAGVPYRFTLIGTSPDEATEQTLKEHLPEQLATGRVRLTGRLGRHDVFSELAHHDAFVLLSDFEGLPVSIVEAMACGCVPVVSTVESGVPEIVTHDANGLVIDGRDYRAWAAALDALRRDEARLHRLSNAARQTVLARLCSDRMADEFAAVFEAVLQDIEHRRYQRPPALTWQNPFDDVLLPPSMQGTTVD
jgi:glycosyltransferase involved in cell wall biosynthesis